MTKKVKQSSRKRMNSRLKQRLENKPSEMFIMDGKPVWFNDRHTRRAEKANKRRASKGYEQSTR